MYIKLLNFYILYINIIFVLELKYKHFKNLFQTMCLTVTGHKLKIYMLGSNNCLVKNGNQIYYIDDVRAN